MPAKNEEEAFEKIIDNNDYTTGNLLDYAYYKKHYKLIAIDLSKQTKLKEPQKINFTGKLSRNAAAANFFLSSKDQKKQLLVFRKILSQ